MAVLRAGMPVCALLRPLLEAQFVATIRRTCDDPAVALNLNRVADILSVPASDQNPELSKSEQLAAVFGGSLVSCDPPDDMGDGLIC